MVIHTKADEDHYLPVVSIVDYAVKDIRLAEGIRSNYIKAYLVDPASVAVVQYKE